MWDQTRNQLAEASLATRLRFVVAMILAFSLLIGVLIFAVKQEGLVAAVAAMLAGIPAIMPVLKRYNRKKTEREASRDQHDL